MKILDVDDVDQENAEDSLETYFYLNIKMLAAMSIFVDFNGKKDFNIFGFPLKIPIISIISLIFCTVDVSYQFWLMISLMASDKKTATLISTNIFSFISTMIKGFRLSTTINNLQNILDDLLKIWNTNRPIHSCRDQIIRKAKKTVLFVKGYIFMTIGLFLTVGIPPINVLWISDRVALKFLFHIVKCIDTYNICRHIVSQYLIRESLNYTYDYSVRIVAMEYPFNIDSGSIFYPIMFKEYWTAFGGTIFWVCGDTLFASLTTHLSLQFEILENDINIYINYESDEQQLKDNLIAFVNRHREILRICKEVERIYSPIIFINVLVSSMNICVNMYMLQEAVLIGAYSDGSLHFFLVFNTLLQIIVYCVFAETLTERSVKLSRSIYNSEWADKNQDFRKCIQMLLMNTQHPFYCTAYGFFSMTHEQFTKIVKTAGSYYMMIRTTS